MNHVNRIRVDTVINGDPLIGKPQLNLTPAQVEQLAAEHDEIEDMLRAMEEKEQSRRLHKPAAVENGRRTSSYSKISFGV